MCVYDCVVCDVRAYVCMIVQCVMCVHVCACVCVIVQCVIVQCVMCVCV